MLLERCHLQRLPRTSIGSAHVSDKVFFEEYPGLARLGARQQPQLGATSDLFRVHAQEARSLLEIQRSHGQRLSTQVYRGDLFAAMAHLARYFQANLTVALLALARQHPRMGATSSRGEPASQRKVSLLRVLVPLPVHPVDARLCTLRDETMQLLAIAHVRRDQAALPNQRLGIVQSRPLHWRDDGYLPIAPPPWSRSPSAAGSRLGRPILE